MIALALVIAAVIVGLVLRRRRAAKALPFFASTGDDDADAAPTDTLAVPPPMAVRPLASPAPASEPAPEPAAGDAAPPLLIQFRPVRAGVNLLSATVESEVVITNHGEVPADDVRVELRLIGAHGGQDADLAAIAREAVTRPAVAPFALQPGEVARISALATLPRAAIVPLDAGGRPIFVPIVTVKLDCAMGSASVRQAAAYAVGVERVDSARLAPFRLDGPPRTFDTVAARVHPIV